MCLAACAGPSPTRADLTGVWRDDGGAELVFEPDGDVILRRIPRQWLFDRDHGSLRPATVTGRWRLSQAADRPAWRSMQEFWDVALTDLRVEGEAQPTEAVVHYKEDGGRPTVFFILGDPDSLNLAEFYRAPG